MENKTNLTTNYLNSIKRPEDTMAQRRHPGKFTMNRNKIEKVKEENQ